MVNTQCSNTGGIPAYPDTLRIQERVRTKIICLQNNYGQESLSKCLILEHIEKISGFQTQI